MWQVMVDKVVSVVAVVDQVAVDPAGANGRNAGGPVLLEVLDLLDLLVKAQDQAGGRTTLTRTWW